MPAARLSAVGHHRSPRSFVSFTWLVRSPYPLVTAGPDVSCRDPDPVRPYDRQVSRILLAPLALVLLLSACGGGDPAADRPSPRESKVTSSATSPHPHGSAPGRRPSAHPSSAHPSVPSRPHHGGKTAPALPAGRTSATAHLLDGDTMPTLADDAAWRVADQGPEGDAAVGACQKTPLVSIGALSAVRRDYAATGSSARAVQVVGRFADAKSAWRAQEVLEAWREDCEQRLDFPHRDVGPLEEVPVPTGVGASYAASYGPKPEAKQTSARLGIVRKGSYVSIVEISSPPTAWPPVGDPARAAVRRIARTFA